MFQFTPSPLVRLWIHLTIHELLSHVGFPIRTSTDHCIFAAPRSFSQLVTSFFGDWCQGIHPALLVTWPLYTHLKANMSIGSFRFSFFLVVLSKTLCLSFFSKTCFSKNTLLFAELYTFLCKTYFLSLCLFFFLLYAVFKVQSSRLRGT